MVIREGLFDLLSVGAVAAARGGFSMWILVGRQHMTRTRQLTTSKGGGTLIFQKALAPPRSDVNMVAAFHAVYNISPDGTYMKVPGGYIAFLEELPEA